MQRLITFIVLSVNKNPFYKRGLCGSDRMVVGFTNTYAISAYHY